MTVRASLTKPYNIGDMALKIDSAIQSLIIILGLPLSILHDRQFTRRYFAHENRSPPAKSRRAKKRKG
jgi:hypothetical protein